MSYAEQRRFQLQLKHNNGQVSQLYLRSKLIWTRGTTKLFIRVHLQQLHLAESRRSCPVHCTDDDDYDYEHDHSIVNSISRLK